jgi:hypothetical protein
LRHPNPRVGYPIKIRNRVVEFSLWPVKIGQGGWISSTKLFVSEPWAIIRYVVEKECRKASKPAALAFLEQAYDYYRSASTANITAAKPVLLYYCFLNLAKVLILTRSLNISLDIAQHGLSERIRPGRDELIGAYIEAYPSEQSINIFDQFLTVIRGSGLSSKLLFDVPVLLRQIVTGHRLFTLANRGSAECFITIHDLQMLDDKSNQLWLRLGITNGALTRLGVSQSALLNRSRLAADWQRVSPPPGSSPDVLWLEQIATTRYSTGWLPDAIPKLIDTVKHNIWQTVLSAPPYRSYYLYLPHLADHPYILPQLLSAYATLYYFSSITRYRPHHFDKILRGEYGPFVESFLHDQPAQMLFLIASEFAKRDVTKAAIVA